jgi:hypothetical protein
MHNCSSTSMRLLRAVTGALLATIGMVAEAHACSCHGGPPESWAARADAVFLGRAVGVGPSVFSEFGGIVTTFAVDSVWKGDVRRRVVVVTDLSSCGGYSPRGESFADAEILHHQAGRGRVQHPEAELLGAWQMRPGSQLLLRSGGMQGVRVSAR